MKHSFRRKACCTFTMLELMIVMVISLVLLGLSLGTYRSLTASSRVEADAKVLSATLYEGRNAALANRQYVACIMPGPGDSGLQNKHKYTVYRLAVVTQSAGTYTFASWLEDSSWSFLSSGVAIMEADDDLGIQDDVSYSIIPEDNQYAQVDDVDLSATLGGGGSVANMRAIVFSPSGKVVGSTLFITLGRAHYDGTTWQITDPAALPTNLSSSSQMTLEVNRFTGTITFLTPDQY